MLQHAIKSLRPAAPFLLVLACFACTNDKQADPGPGIACDTAQVSYSRQIKPIVAANCALSGCHIAGFAHGDFNRYEELKSASDRGKLHQQVIERKTMPPIGPLPTEEQKLIECWIRQSAPNN